MCAEKRLNALVCPLGWGLGHASRDIPVINELLKNGYGVYIAGDAPQLEYLKCYFPSLPTIVFPSFRVKYCKCSSQLLPMIWVAMRLPFYNVWEHACLKKLLKKHDIDVIISDNRYGLWSKQVKSVIITHQLRVIPPYPFKWAMSWTESISRRWLKRFSQVWIPDHCNENNIAGLLSKPNGLANLRYIGLLSRFSEISTDGVSGSFEMVVLASGPEPQRSLFVDISSKLALNLGLNCLIAEGKPENGVVPRNVSGVWHVGHLPDLQLALAVKCAKYLVIRGGYSTIMDMLTLGVSGLLIPTPGQTEQEYLVAHVSQKKLFKTVKQSNLPNIKAKTMLSGVGVFTETNRLEEAVKELILPR